MKYVSATLALIMSAGAASAGTVICHFVPFQSANGGEFRVEGSLAGMHSQFSDITAAHPYDLRGGDASTTSYANAADFQSFCLERNENVSNNGVYQFSIDTYAFNGGVGGQTAPNQDSLSNATRWIYSSFRRGTLANYAYNGATRSPGGADNSQVVVADQIASEGWSVWTNFDGTNDSKYNRQEARRERAARTLQTAIWYLEDELSISGSPLPATVPSDADANPNSLVQAEWDQLIAWVNAANAAPIADYGVRVLNLWTDRAGTHAHPGQDGVYDAGIDTRIQSQLTLIPLPTGSGLALVGLGGLAIRRRRGA